MYIQVTNNNIVLRMFLGEIWKEGKGKGLEIKERGFLSCAPVLKKIRRTFPRVLLHRDPIRETNQRNITFSN